MIIGARLKKKLAIKWGVGFPVTPGLTHVNTTYVTSMICRTVAVIWCELLHAVHTPLSTASESLGDGL